VTASAAAHRARARRSWRETEARNTVGFRHQDEWIRRMAEESGDQAPSQIFVCECGDAACHEPIRRTIGEYAAVRSSATRFAVAPTR
jgi:hypothetical protein